MMINLRQMQLIKMLVNEDHSRTVHHYSEKLNVSDRTVQSDLQTVENYLNSRFAIQLIKKRGVGISIIVSQKDRLKILNTISNNNDSESEGSIIERREIITSLLLTNTRPTNFRKLADDFFVSVSSITADIKEIEKWLSTFHVLIDKGKQGTRINGLEINIRKAFIALIQQRLDRTLKFTGMQDVGDKVNEEKINGIVSLFVSNGSIKRSKQMIYFLERQINCRFNDLYYVNMLVTCAVILERLKNQHIINPSSDLQIDMENYHALKTYIAAKEVLEKFGENEINKEEIQFLNQYIMGTGIEERIGMGTNRKYGTEIQELARILCKLASEALQIDMSNDLILYQGLLAHLEPMIHRLKNNIIIKNPFLLQIKQQYSAIFGLTCLLGAWIENETHLKINENELGFLMVHFQAAIERNKSQTKIVVVCPGGIGTSELVANKIMRILPNIKITGIFSIRNLNMADLSNIDFIVSTVPLKNINKPVIVVSPMVDLTDAKSINNYYLENFYQKNNHFVRGDHLLSVVATENIFLNKEINTKSGIIRYLSEQLAEKGYVTRNFQHSVEEREQIASTDLGNSIAIPHGKGKYVNKSTIAIATVNKPINWGESKVKLIFVIALSDDDKHQVRKIMGDLYNLFESEELVKKLMETDTVTEFITLLTHELTN